MCMMFHSSTIFAAWYQRSEVYTELMATFSSSPLAGLIIVAMTTHRPHPPSLHMNLVPIEARVSRRKSLRDVAGLNELFTTIDKHCIRNIFIFKQLTLNNCSLYALYVIWRFYLLRKTTFKAKWDYKIKLMIRSLKIISLCSDPSTLGFNFFYNMYGHNKTLSNTSLRRSFGVSRQSSVSFCYCQMTVHKVLTVYLLFISYVMPEFLHDLKYNFLSFWTNYCDDMFIIYKRKKNNKKRKKKHNRSRRNIKLDIKHLASMGTSFQQTCVLLAIYLQLDLWPHVPGDLELEEVTTWLTCCCKNSIVRLCIHRRVTKIHQKIVIITITMSTFLFETPCFVEFSGGTAGDVVCASPSPGSSKQNIIGLSVCLSILDHMI